MKKNTGLIIKIAVAIVVLAAASACFIIFRDAIFVLRLIVISCFRGGSAPPPDHAAQYAAYILLIQ